MTRTTSFCSTGSERLHRCCYLTNKVEYIDHTPSSLYTLQQAGKCPPNKFPLFLGNLGPQLICGTSSSVPPKSMRQMAPRSVQLTVMADRQTQTTEHRTIGRILWRRGVVVSGVRRMNDVNARRARLVLGWVTVFGRVYHLGMKQAN